jgi:uncharacterized glyoxalase superfamily protein PhnB
MEEASPTLTPTVNYTAPEAGIQWLTDVLGFHPAGVYRDASGKMVFAQLVWRTAFVFVSPRPPASNPWSAVGIASIALAAIDKDDVQLRYEKAVAAGADIVRPLHDSRTPMFPEGSTGFDVRDPEGNLWTVGTFRPKYPK